jgi:RimJ/RimL family protein N-acetyltransferase
MNIWFGWIRPWLTRQRSKHVNHKDLAPGGKTRAPLAAASQTIPIREIKPTHTNKIHKHLTALSPEDRYLRFGYAANDEQIGHYIQSINFERDSLFGIYNRRLDLIAMAHLSYSIDPNCASCAEFGVSVAHPSRGRGYGTRLFDRAITHARNVGVRLMFVHALSENTAMIKIAKRAGAKIERDGPDSQAHLMLPPADMDSRWEEMMDQQVAWTDYQLKTQAKQFWGWLNLNHPSRTAQKLQGMGSG